MSLISFRHPTLSLSAYWGHKQSQLPPARAAILDALGSYSYELFGVRACSPDPSPVLKRMPLYTLYEPIYTSEIIHKQM